MTTREYIGPCRDCGADVLQSSGSDPNRLSCGCDRFAIALFGDIVTCEQGHRFPAECSCILDEATPCCPNCRRDVHVGKCERPATPDLRQDGIETTRQLDAEAGQRFHDLLESYADWIRYGRHDHQAQIDRVNALRTEFDAMTRGRYRTRRQLASVRAHQGGRVCETAERGVR